MVLVALPYAQDLNLAILYETQGRLTEARQVLRQYLLRNPLDTQAYRRYQAMAFKLQAYDELIALVDTLLLAFPGQSDLMIGRAEAFIRSGRKSAGVGILENLARQRIELTQQVGRILEDNQLFAEAIRLYQEYRRRKNNPTIFSSELLRLYEQTGDYRAATQEGVRLLNIDNALAGEYERKFQSYVQRSDPEPIIEQLRKVTNPATRCRLLARVLLAAGRGTSAITEVERLNSHQEMLDFARYCEQAGYLEVALELYQRITDNSLQWHKAQLLRKLGRIREAVDVLQSASTPEALFELAELQRLELKDYVQAAEGYREIVKIKPDYFQAYYGLSRCLLRQGDFKEAESALKAMPKLTDQALYELALLFFYQEKFDSCKNRIEQLLTDHPQSHYTNDGLELLVLIARGGEGLKTYARARFAFEQGDIDSAISLCRAIINSDRQWADQAYLLLADCYRGNREMNQALSALAEMERNLPQSEFRARSRYLQAIIYLDNFHDEAQYRKLMESVFMDFPDSPYAALARNRLLPGSKTDE